MGTAKDADGEGGETDEEVALHCVCCLRISEEQVFRSA